MSWYGVVYDSLAATTRWETEETGNHQVLARCEACFKKESLCQIELICEGVRTETSRPRPTYQNNNGLTVRNRKIEDAKRQFTIQKGPIIRPLNQRCVKISAQSFLTTIINVPTQANDWRYPSRLQIIQSIKQTPNHTRHPCILKRVILLDYSVRRFKLGVVENVREIMWVALVSGLGVGWSHKRSSERS